MSIDDTLLIFLATVRCSFLTAGALLPVEARLTALGFLATAFFRAAVFFLGTARLRELDILVSRIVSGIPTGLHAEGSVRKGSWSLEPKAGR
jgi:hypothetical protein